MRKRIIAVDCDDVIVATAPAILDFYNNKFGTALGLKDFYTKDLAVLGVDDYETAVRRIDSFLETKEYQETEPLKDAIEVIRQLGKYHDLHMVTGRSDSLAAATKTMLQKYFPDIFKSVEFTNFFGQTARPKSQVCQDLGADLLIDDHLYHATIVAECGVDVLLFGDYPWNQADTLPAGVTRVPDWHAVAEKLLP